MNKQALLFSIGFLLLAGEAAAQKQSGEMKPSDEVHIQQETGHYKVNKTPVPLNPAKTGPEGTATSVPAGATNPNTCDPKNATSPSCYTATQQGHK